MPDSSSPNEEGSPPVMLPPVDSFDGCNENFQTLTTVVTSMVSQMQAQAESTNKNLTKLAEETQANLSNLADDIKSILSGQAMMLVICIICICVVIVVMKEVFSAIMHFI